MVSNIILENPWEFHQTGLVPGLVIIRTDRRSVSVASATAVTNSDPFGDDGRFIVRSSGSLKARFQQGRMAPVWTPGDCFEFYNRGRRSD